MIYKPLLKALPLLVALSLTNAMIYFSSQIILRSSANDPQIQMAEELALKLQNGETVNFSQKFDLKTSLATIVSVYDNNYNLKYSTATLDGKAPKLPQETLELAKINGQNQLTWEPSSNIRLATVIQPFRISNDSIGYVVTARSLRETENRQTNINRIIISGWLLSYVLVILTAYSVDWFRHMNSKKPLEEDEVLNENNRIEDLDPELNLEPEENPEPSNKKERKPHKKLAK